LSKTAAWKQLTFAGNNSPISNHSPIDTADGKKRRRKRSRTSKNGGGKDGSPIGTVKSSPVENNELIEMNGHQIVPDEATEHHLKPWMTQSYDAEDDISAKNKHLARQGMEERSPHSAKHIPRQQSFEDRNSLKRQRSKDRGSTKDRNKSSSLKRHDCKKPHERSKQEHRSNSLHNKPSKAQHRPVEETALPPWEQPYLSPPRKDFGLLHIPTDNNVVPDIDPAATIVPSSENTFSPVENETKTTFEDEIPSSLVNDRRQSDGSIITDSPRRLTTKTAYDSGDASAELDC